MGVCVCVPGASLVVWFGHLVEPVGWKGPVSE